MEQERYRRKGMRNLIFIVEGQTESEFVNRIIKPYFVSKGLQDHQIRSIIITMSGGGHGFNNIEHFKNTIRPVLYQKDEPIITTFIDHYGINSEQKLPGYCECIKELDVEKRIQQMESQLNKIVQEIKDYRFFIPYIQRHEFETLLFSNPSEGFSLENDRIRESIISLCSAFFSIEDINCTPQGAPSKRIDKIYSENSKSYNKVVDGVDIAELTTLKTILEKCPRFKSWIEQLIREATTD